MKSRKILKREIKKSFDILYRDIVFYKAFVVNADKNAARTVLDKMPEIKSELIKRVSVNEGKHVKGRVKMYFTKLREDVKKKTNEIAQEIDALTQKK